MKEIHTERSEKLVKVMTGPLGRVGRMILGLRSKMDIDKDTRVADILREYGDIAEMMEIFGVQRVGRYSVRALAAKALSVEWAARIHRVPLDEFLDTLRRATALRQPATDGGAGAPPIDMSGV